MWTTRPRNDAGINITAPNAGIQLWFHLGHASPGVGDPERSQQDGVTPRRQDPKMNANAIGKEVVDAAVKAPRKLGFLLRSGANLMKDAIERIVHGQEDADLGVFASLRKPCLQCEPGNGMKS